MSAEISCKTNCGRTVSSRSKRGLCAPCYSRAYHAGELPDVGKIRRGFRALDREIPEGIGPTELGRLLGVSRQRADQILNRDKHAARAAVAYAIKTGRMVKPDACERCTLPDALHAHHPDYSKPLEVQWVCSPCHAVVHPHQPYAVNRKLGAQVRAATVARQAAETQDRINEHPVMQAARMKCEALGLSFMPTGVRRATINGFRCEIGRLIWRGQEILSLPHKSAELTGIDFSLRWNDRLDKWVVIPSLAYPRKGTSFALNAPQAVRPGAYSHRHDFRDYVEAWHLLVAKEKPQQIAA